MQTYYDKQTDYSEDEWFEFISKSYGGYWRYPEMIDFCFLVNPYYPPESMIDEFNYNFRYLLTAYPSGQKINSMLAAEYYGVYSDYIAVGNGAAELIKALMEGMNGNVGLISPTFDEYPNRIEKNKRITYVIGNDNFTYTVDDICNYFNDKDITALVFVNPDNPGSNYIGKDEIGTLLEWSADKGIKIIIDDSFVAFTNEYPFSLINNSTLDKYKNLIVINSISKAHGVPGLRLGVLACADTKLISILKKDISIWNINSFAEYYLQIMGKYKSEYEHSLAAFRETRHRLMAKLNHVEGLRIIPTNTNYYMAEVLCSMTAYELARTLLCKYNIFIKDLTSKVSHTGKQYIRMAIRTDDENELLLKAFKDVIG